jgi:multidrug efflux pump subunit AcrB
MSPESKPVTTEKSWIAKVAGQFYADPRLTVLTLLLVVASGGSSLWVLPQMEDPLLTQRAANVTTLFPGADAEKVESLVTEKIEEKLREVSEIKRFRSQSRAGVSFIAIELRDDIYEPDPVWSKIRGKIEDSIAMLPAGASRPSFDDLDIAAYAWIGAIVATDGQAANSSVMRRTARDLKDQLLLLAGTKTVDLFGDPGEEIVIELDPERCAALGLSPAQVAREIAARDVKSASGLIRDGKSETVVQFRNEFQTVDDIKLAALRTSEVGNALTLQEVATVQRGAPDPVASKVIVDGREGVVFGVMLRPEVRIDQWTKQAEKVTNDFRVALPVGMQLVEIMKQQQYVDERMSNLTNNLWMSIAAVALTTFFFLGWRSSLLVTATLPVASLMVIAFMRALDIPIHQMSVTGLILAMGLLIDNAIIAADEVGLSLHRGMSAREAAEDMVTRLFGPLVASTVTTALSFAPIALMEGPAGEFVSAIAVTVILAIGSSLFLALTILPAASAWLLSSDANSDGHTPGGIIQLTTSADTYSHWWKHGFYMGSMHEAYARFLRFIFGRPWIGVAIGVVLPIAGFVAAAGLKEQFFPPTDRDQFHIEVELASEASIGETEKLSAQLESTLRRNERVKGVAWFLGESAPPFYYNVIARRKNAPNYAQAIVTLNSNVGVQNTIRNLQSQLNRDYPQARILVRQLEQGPPFAAPLEIRLYGPDLARLQQIGGELQRVVSSQPTVVMAHSTLSENRPAATIAVDVQQANWADLSEQEIADQLFARLEGLPAGMLIEETEQVPVRVRMSKERRESVENLKDSELIRFASFGSQQSLTSPAINSEHLTATLPLSSLAKVEIEPQRALITRYNGVRINDIQGFIVAGTLPSTALKGFQESLQKEGFKLPAGYRMDFGGETSERDQAVQRLMASVTVLAIGMVASLVLALASFRKAALIGMVAALSVGLGLGSLWLFGYPFGFMAIIGTMGLIGVAINDSIVVVSAISANPLAAQGDIEASTNTVVDVTRHVLATTATTVVGFVPLIVGGGGFWPPLAVSIGAGVLGATLIALTFVPCCMQLMSRWNRSRPTGS